MGFLRNLFKKETVTQEVINTPIQEVINTPVIQEEISTPTEDKTPLVELTAAQALLLETFKEVHKTGCGMEMYQIVIAHKDGKGDRMFAKCPMCNHGLEIDSDNTPSTRLF